ncbi:MAG: ABZJ_00895 family protein [Pseudomonadota bacterium]|nr:ABZJ_00895 family protein [Pseudomonadota bacterium]
MYLYYAIILVGISLTLTAATVLFDFAPPTSIGLIIASVSAIYPGQIFVQQTGRLMAVRERVAFAIGASVLGFAVSIVQMAAGMVIAGARLSLEGFRQYAGISGEIGYPVMVGVTLFSLLITGAAIYFFVNMMGKQTLGTTRPGS